MSGVSKIRRMPEYCSSDMAPPDIELNETNYKRVCRLCLRVDDELSIDIFDRIDPNPRKSPLSIRIFELYQIRVFMTNPLLFCYWCLLLLLRL